MPKTSVLSSNALFGFFWWFHMWGHSVVDPIWNWISNISICNDLEEMVTELPWQFGMFFWWVPTLFFTIFWLMGFYAIVFANFWFMGLLGMAFGKFLGAGWIRYGQRVMHPVLSGMPWYDKQFAHWSGSKKAGLHIFRATALSKSVSGVYTAFKAVVGRKIVLVQARIKQLQDERQ